MLEEDEVFGTLPTILTATRLKQPQSEAPASVTIIDRTMIEAAGVRDIAEIFRLVPGMQVAYYSGHRPAVTYHGPSEINAKRLQVLIDGRSVYQPGLSRILWSDLPISLEDINRIEVIRGPNSAVYGANAYQAIINIITDLPAETIGLKTSWSVGNRGINDYYVRYSGTLNQATYSVKAGTQRDEGFDSNFENQAKPDDRKLKFANLDLNLQVNEKNSLRVLSGLRIGSMETEPVNDSEQGDFHPIYIRNYFLQGIWQTSFSLDHTLKSSLYYSKSQRNEDWTTCTQALFLSDELAVLVDTDRDYTLELVDAIQNNPPEDLAANLPIPPTPTIATLTGAVLNRLLDNGLALSCGFTNQNIIEERVDLELQDTIRLTNHLRLVGGFNLRRDSVDSQTYFGREVENTIGRLFANFEWRAHDSLLVNLGAAYEEDNIIGSESSPRLAFNFLLDEEQALRLVFAHASRSPDLFEEEANWSYNITNLSPPVNPPSTSGRFFITGIAEGQLRPEQIRSTELGYYYGSSLDGFEFDIKIYKNKLSDLIDNTLDITQGNFSIENSGRLNIQGVEFQLQYKPSADVLLWLSYAYIDIDELNPITIPSESIRYNKSSPRHSGSTLLSYKISPQSQVSFAMYYLNHYFENNYVRGDIRYKHQWHNPSSYSFYTEVIVQSRIDDNQFFGAYDSEPNIFLKFGVDL